MFLLSPEIFFWDALILLLLTIAISAALLCGIWSTLHKKKFGTTAAKVCSWFFVGCTLLIVYAAFIEPQMLVINRFEVTHSFGQPITIAVVSDLHVGPYKDQKFIERVVRKINNELPDIILIPGDFIFGPQANLEALLPLADLRAPLGTFAVLGNHDEGMYSSLIGKPVLNADRGEEIADFLNQIGVTVLRNENRVISLPEGDIVISGVDDYFTGHHSVAQAMRDIPKSVFSILLSHNPSVIEEAGALNAHLIVSGHTHGGQVRLPWFGAMAPLPISIDQSFDQGVFQIDDDTILAISRGAGESHARVRLLAAPEVMILHIK